MYVKWLPSTRHQDARVGCREHDTLAVGSLRPDSGRVCSHLTCGFLKTLSLGFQACSGILRCSVKVSLAEHGLPSTASFTGHRGCEISRFVGRVNEDDIHGNANLRNPVLPAVPQPGPT